MTRRCLAALAATVMVAGASAADAATYLFASSLPVAGGSITGAGTIRTDDSVAMGFDGAFTGRRVRSIAGTYDGAPIVGLVPVNTVDGNDNLVDTSGGPLDFDGIAFQLATTLPGYAPVGGYAHTIVNLYGYGGSYTDNGPAGVGAFTLTAVPEPATWAMLLVGFAGVGFAQRHRARGVAA